MKGTATFSFDWEAVARVGLPVGCPVFGFIMTTTGTATFSFHWEAVAREVGLPVG